MALEPLTIIQGMPGTLRSKAKVLGVSAGYLSDLLKGHRKPGPKLLNALGLEVSYRRRK
jgi:transcriptional regulator with XRE-family HTH domain